MTDRGYSLTEENRKEFAGIFVLEYMVNRPKAFDVYLEDNDADLEPILLWLMVKEYVEIKEDDKYVPTDLGRKCVVNFIERYTEFLTMYDMYCAVDLGTGEFAFARYFEFDDADEWRDFIDNDRWEDLRIAVADFKGIDPIEIVFMSFINEKRFGRDKTGWQFDLLIGEVWDEILTICNTALHKEDLAYESDGEAVAGDTVMQDVIIQGAELMIQLLEKEDSIAQSISHDDSDGGNGEPHYVERVEYVHHPAPYYEPYYDPFYISPVWVALWLL
jgi:hypothetical protein